MSEQPETIAAFISYASDDRDKAFEVCRLLESQGLKCWIAPRNVRAGREYADEIVRGIEHANAFVLLLSAAANGSIFVRREVERAVSKNKPVFPMRIENVQPATAIEFFISSTQWIDAWSGSLEEHTAQLARDLSGNTISIPERKRTRKAPAFDFKNLVRVGLPILGAAAIAAYFATREPSVDAQYEQQAWQGAALADTVPGYEAYLRLLGDGARHARQAKARIADLNEADDKKRAEQTSAPGGGAARNEGQRTATNTPTNNERGFAPPVAAQPVLSGTWQGQFGYDDNRLPVGFSMSVTSDDRTCTGRTEEVNTFGDSSASKLYGNVSCPSQNIRKSGRVRWSKTYDGTGGVNHSVNYDGTISADGTRIEGRWRVGSASGPFTLTRVGS